MTGERPPRLLVLGPLVLRGEDGEDIPLGGVRPRRLLAVLAMRVGEWVSPEQLIDGTWGEAPPPSARRNLSTYLWSLRAALAAAGGSIAIGTSPAGYRLGAGDGDLDWEQFAKLTATAKACLPGDPRGAGGLLRQALALWRGTPAADVSDDMPSLAARVAVMEEARLAALELRIEADLSAGMDRELVAELASLSAEYPFRERLRAQLMVALYRSGRRAEALSAYHSLRRELAAEFGIDPDPQVRALFEAMLQSSPGVERTAVAGPEARQETLGQRAAAVRGDAFQGRDDELTLLLGMLQDPGGLPGIVSLHGPAGMGKTELLYALARSCQARGWPAVIIDSRDFHHDAATLSGVVARATARDPGDDRPRLLAFDTFEEMADVDRDLWEIVLPAVSGPVLVILSGRRPAEPRPGLEHWRALLDELELPGLPEAAAGRVVKRHGVSDPVATARVLSFAGGNPLLLAIAARHARLAGVGGSWMPDRRLIGLVTREDTDPEVQELLDAASLVRTFTEEMLTVMLGRDISPAFGRLCALSFVRVVAHGARVHDLVRESVAADLRWRAPAASREMLRRARRYLGELTTRSGGPWVQELVLQAADESARARFFAPPETRSRLRSAEPGDLPRLLELCRDGESRFGIPPAVRAAQLTEDFTAALPTMSVTLDDDGNVTAFNYVIRLHAGTWRAAAATRGPFFDALPSAELAAIRAAPDDAAPALLVAGTTHLPGQEHVNAALRWHLFQHGATHRGRAPEYLTYILMTACAPEVAEVADAGAIRRETAIDFGSWLGDNWVFPFNHLSFANWIAESLGDSAPLAEP